MKVYKGYVENLERPEGCIAERYIIEESILDCMEYIPNGDRGNHKHSRQELFDKSGEFLDKGPLDKGKDIRLTNLQFEQVRRWVLEEMNRERSAKDDIINKLVSDVEDIKGTLGDLKELCTRLHMNAAPTPTHPHPPQPITGSTSSSSINKSNTVANDQFSSTSLYRLLDGRRQIIAHGNMMTDASQVHGVFVVDDEIKVRIGNIFLPATPLTSPNSFASTVDDVGIGGYTTWLKSRVVIKPANEKI